MFLERLAQREEGASSMGTVEGTCLTGGLISIWGHLIKVHVIALCALGRRLSSHRGRGGAAEGLPQGPDESAAEPGMNGEK